MRMGLTQGGGLCDLCPGLVSPRFQRAQNVRTRALRAGSALPPSFANRSARCQIEAGVYMIRRDYLLGMIDQCIQALANSLRWMEHGQFSEAQTEIEQTIRGLVGLELTQVLTLSETELLGALLRDEPTQLLRQKGMLLVSLLHRAGAIHAAQGNAELSHACSLRALDLQLDLLLREGQFDFPEFVPRVDALVQALKDVSLPVRTNVALMRHYESTGAFANAEDALFSLLEGHSAEKELLQFGIQFYERLAHQSDTALELGNLPRPEVEAGLAELRTRAAA